jgi:metal-responsive CopG/Arc/MetJ family transcriptional regulator
MASKKVTFTFDDGTVGRIDRTAQRLGMSKSRVVREAVREYAERVGRLSESERLRVLRIFDEMVERIPERSLDEVEREIKQVRVARRGGGRRTLPEPS